MRTKLLIVLLLMIPLLGFSNDVKIKKYKKVDTFSPTEAAKVKILNEKPKEAHILLGEILFVPPAKMKVAEINKIMVTEAAKLGAHAIFYRIDIKYVRPNPKATRRSRVFKRKVRTGIALRFK